VPRTRLADSPNAADVNTPLVAAQHLTADAAMGDLPRVRELESVRQIDMLCFVVDHNSRPALASARSRKHVPLEKEDLMHSKILLAALLALSLGVLSCEKLEVGTDGPLQYVVSDISDGIAEELGRFVAVTPHPTEAYLAALWFEQDDGTISVVWVNVNKRTIHKKILTIPRK